jgi:hypothetical protein
MEEGSTTTSVSARLTHRRDDADHRTNVRDRRIGAERPAKLSFPECQCTVTTSPTFTGARVPVDFKRSLQELEGLDFTGKGEAFVESRFLTPLLECLGYETHKDYEVVRHGDDGSAFKLHYPPVEKGAQRVKHYNPDYVPTIRKKLFWIIEAKSPKDVAYPFEAKYLVQGLQYCIHPEIQAKYLLVTNGAYSAVYDAHGAVFFEKEIYEPIFEFRSSELIRRWDEIFNLLSVERLRTRIETDLKAMYDKLCQSSLDKTYPHRLLNQIGASAGQNARQIEKHVLKLYVEGMDRERDIWLEHMEQLDAAQVYSLMDLRCAPGPDRRATTLSRRASPQACRRGRFSGR